MVDIVSLAGLIYTISKDAWSYVNEKHSKNRVAYKQVRDKQVNTSTYLQESGIEAEWLAKGYQLTWARKDNVPSLELKGWEIVYVTDEKKKEIYSLVGRDTRLVGKKVPAKEGEKKQLESRKPKE